MTARLHRPLWILALVVAVLGCGLLIRLHDYTAAPPPSDNVDELAWTWAGMSLIENHSPTSWSFLHAYPSYVPVREPGSSRILPVVHPWLDHPPGFALVMGGIALAAGERRFEDVSDVVIRLPVIALSIVSMLLMFLLGRRLLGQASAIAGIALFALAPGAVLGSRVVESEALLAPMLLLMLLVADRILEEESTWWDGPVLLAVCLLAPVIKVPGVAFGVIAAVPLAIAGRLRLAALAVSMSMAGLLVYLGYGALVDWRQLLAVLHAQDGRHVSLISGYEFVTSPAGFADVEPLRDGWWLLGWIALVAVARESPRKGLLLAWPVVGFALAITLMADPSAVDRYGWYRFAVYPLVYLIAGHFVLTAVIRPNLVSVALILFVAGATATLGLGAAGGPLRLATEVPLIVAGIGVLAAMAAARLREPGRQWWYSRMPQVALAALAIMILVLNAVQSFRLADIFRFL